MKIADIYKSKSLTTSFEVFPPNDKVGLEQVYNCLDILSLEKPDYISVTYGAGGNTKGRTVEIADRIKRQNGVESLAHLTCIGAKKEEIDRVLEDLEKNNIENILALRGDYPVDRELEKGDFNYARELIEYIHKKKGDKFSIGAAYYVEGHRETNDILDLFYLKEKNSMWLCCNNKIKMRNMRYNKNNCYNESLFYMSDCLMRYLSRYFLFKRKS